MFDIIGGIDERAKMHAMMLREIPKQSIRAKLVSLVRRERKAMRKEKEVTHSTAARTR